VLGRRFDTAADVALALDRAARGHPMAKAGIEMAAWDLEARLRGISLAELLGGVRDAVPSGVSIGIQPDEAVLLAQVARYVGEGYGRIKLKIAPEWDVHIVERVREQFPTLPLSVDANAAYTTRDAELLATLDRFDLVMVEQPYADDELLALGALQGMMRTPICLDESVTSAARCAEALHLSAGRIVNIKPGRVGGHAAARRIHDLCAAAGVPVWCGGMLETGIGRAHNVALATLPNFTMPNDISASRRYWARDVVAPEFVLRSDAMIPLPSGVGIGVEVDEEYLTSIEEYRRTFELVAR
jgi:O-succinylbenzoate synthase